MGCIRLDILEQDYKRSEHKMFTIKSSLTKNKTKINVRSGYLYGMNGQEKDDEIKGDGNSYDFGARMYDSRLGKWMSTDPMKELYPSNSPYHFGYNNPIYYKDNDGRVISGATKKDFAELYSTVQKIFNKNAILKSIFKTASNEMQFEKISQKDFDDAVRGLDENTKALAKGYFEAINSKYEYQVMFVDNETIIDADFKKSALDKDNINITINSGSEIANVDNRGAYFYKDEEGCNKSILIINEQYIQNDDKIISFDQYGTSPTEKRTFEAAVTNSIFGKFFQRDVFISKKRETLLDSYTTKIQCENLVLRKLNLPLFTGLPHYGNGYREEQRKEIPEELKVEKDTGTHQNPRYLEDGGIQNE